MAANSCVDLVGAERGGRLVHDEHARLVGQRPRDLDHLLLREPERAHGRAHVERHAEAAQQPLGVVAHRAASRRCPAPRRGALPRKMFSATDRCGTRVSSW